MFATVEMVGTGRSDPGNLLSVRYGLEGVDTDPEYSERGHALSALRSFAVLGCNPDLEFFAAHSFWNSASLPTGMRADYGRDPKTTGYLVKGAIDEIERLPLSEGQPAGLSEESSVALWSSLVWAHEMRANSQDYKNDPSDTEHVLLSAAALAWRSLGRAGDLRLVASAAGRRMMRPDVFGRRIEREGVVMPSDEDLKAIGQEIRHAKSVAMTRLGGGNPLSIIDNPHYVIEEPDADDGSAGRPVAIVTARAWHEVTDVLRVGPKGAEVKP